MALTRITSTYQADSGGFKEILSGSKMGDVALDAAESVASAAGPNYEAARSTVTAGWSNESRAGAVVREVSRDASDARSRKLLAVVESMGRRSL